MKTKKNKLLLAGVLCLALCACLTLPAAANSAPRYWEGVYATGAMLADENCPLVVEHETLTFDIPMLPEAYYASPEEFLAYNATVTAEYTFYNPTDMTVTANLLFPYGVSSVYGSYYDYETGEYFQVPDAYKYGAQINTESVETTIRHSYTDGSYNYNFDPATAMSYLSDSYVSDRFLRRDLPVYVYTYQISGVDTQTWRTARAGAYFDYDPDRTMVMLDSYNNGRATNEGVLIGTSVGNGQQITLWVMGEDIGSVQWSFYENGSMENVIAGHAELISKQTTTFEAVAMQSYDASSVVLAHDWFNAIVACLEQSRWDDTCVYYSTYLRNWDVSDSLLEWYEYDISLAPGERLINTVTAPLYPSIDGGYTPYIYTYVYLLSPASLWADFGTLDIYVNTPYYMVDIEAMGVSADAFQKTETGYEAHLEGLPAEDLHFTLCTDPAPEADTGPWGAILFLLLFYVIVILVAMVLMAVAVVGCVLQVAVILFSVLGFVLVGAASIVLIILLTARSDQNKKIKKDNKKK